MPRPKGATSGRIEKRVLIQASSAIVFDALTDAHDLIHWFCDRASSRACVGGELQASWNHGKLEQMGRAIYKQLSPESMVELQWIDDGHGDLDPSDARHILTYQISSKRGSTEVRMSDVDERDLDEQDLAILNEGWNGVLLELKEYCERKERATKRGEIQQSS